MLLVFKFYRLFSPFEFCFFLSFVFLSSAGVQHNLAVLERAHRSPNQHILKKPSGVGSIIIAGVGRRWSSLPAELGFILRDTVGLGSRTSQAAAVPSLPSTDESWLPGQPAPTFYFNHFCSEVESDAREGGEKANMNTRTNQDRLRTTPVLCPAPLLPVKWNKRVKSSVGISNVHLSLFLCFIKEETNRMVETV